MSTIICTVLWFAWSVILIVALRWSFGRTKTIERRINKSGKSHLTTSAFSRHPISHVVIISEAAPGVTVFVLTYKLLPWCYRVYRLAGDILFFTLNTQTSYLLSFFSTRSYKSEIAIISNSKVFMTHIKNIEYSTQQQIKENIFASDKQNHGARGQCKDNQTFSHYPMFC